LVWRVTMLRQPTFTSKTLRLTSFDGEHTAGFSTEPQPVLYPAHLPMLAAWVLSLNLSLTTKMCTGGYYSPASDSCLAVKVKQQLPDLFPYWCTVVHRLQAVACCMHIRGSSNVQKNCSLLDMGAWSNGSQLATSTTLPCTNM
jgi:hypothetical protein